VFDAFTPRTAFNVTLQNHSRRALWVETQARKRRRKLGRKKKGRSTEAIRTRHSPQEDLQTELKTRRGTANDTLAAARQTFRQGEKSCRDEKRRAGWATEKAAMNNQPSTTKKRQPLTEKDPESRAPMARNKREL